ncbi:cupin domain-containing protein [Pigmentiphaga sp.]|uniref:cupin domain-containing protein n=1 Tax=Pigmentiphaga sp. TaxID=1977564 RepID=UPI00128B5B36|nr:cupin domain-containing protein [Pigmentiphaga sp.]MPS30431.1 cupin domain-containing protein [Alcaligenaceae bacterium SAGV5]MPS52034.1 cupin domain-containing protein [Alcaligenaceae bacterium SAGV3]MPT59518.1 cupin domain-containing protein [Alcaligenaceae bacterium]
MTIKTPSGAALLKLDTLPTYDRGGGAATTPLVGRGVGSDSFITGYTSFGPGAQIPFHSHNCQESVVLIEGDAMLDIDGEEHRLKPLDATFIPPGVPHRFRNLSATQPMRILWIYATPDATRTLVGSGETRPVSAEHH